jgi:4-aminobutyrate aminotransferase-like enzyme
MGKESMENSQQVGAYLKEGLYTLKGQYPSIVEIRGAGLFIG